MTSNLILPKGQKKISRDEMIKLRQEGNRKVKGVFRCFEPMGGSIKFSFKAFPGDPIVTYSLLDGETYDLPLCVAQHLRNNCSYPTLAYVLDGEGKPVVNVAKCNQRCTFEATSFLTAMGDGE
jgi:hypothetical protein